MENKLKMLAISKLKKKNNNSEEVCRPYYGTFGNKIMLVNNILQSNISNTVQDKTMWDYTKNNY